MNGRGFLIRAGWPAAAAVLLAVAGYMIFAEHYRSVERQLARARAEADRIQVDLKNSQKTIDDLAAARESIRKYLPDMFRIDETQKLIDRMAEKATENGAVMVDIQLDVPKFMEARKDEEPILPVPFEASFAGDFFSLGSLTSDLENAPFVYKLTETGLVLSGEKDDELSMTVKGAVRFFSKNLVGRYISDAE